MHARREHFNRTIQQEFVNRREERQIGNPVVLNDHLFPRRHQYNIERTHHGISLRAPLDVLSHQLGNECRMQRTNTVA